MHSEEKTALGATQESPFTSPHREGSAPGAHLEPPRDPGAHHHLSSGHSGTHLPVSGLQSFFLALLWSLPFLHLPSSTPLAPYHPALLSFFPGDFIPFAYSPIIYVFSAFLSSTSHAKTLLRTKEMYYTIDTYKELVVWLPEGQS